MTGTAAMTGAISATNPGATVSSLPFSDAFTRADGAPGQPWYWPSCGSELQIVSDTLRAPNTAQNRAALLMPQDDFDATSTIHFKTADGQPDQLQLSFGATTCHAPPFYVVAMDPHDNPGVTLAYTTDRISFTTVASNSTPGLAEGSTHTLRVVRKGSLCRVYIDGAAYINYSSLSGITGQRMVWCSITGSTTSYFDNLSIAAPDGNIGPLAVQQVAAGAPTGVNGTSWSFHPSADTTAGNTLILAVRSRGTLTPTISDSQGNTWHTDIVSSPLSGPTVAICRAYLSTALTTSDTVTVTIPSAAVNDAFGYQAIEYNGVPSAPTVDVTASHQATGATDTAGPTSALSQNNELAITAFAFNNSQTTLGLAAPWAKQGTPVTTGISGGVAMGDRLPNGGDTLSATWTAGTSTTGAVAIAAYTT